MTITLTGREIFPNDGNPIIGADVYIYNKGSSTLVDQTVTDANGSWTWTSAGAGNADGYDIKVIAGWNIRWQYIEQQVQAQSVVVDGTVTVRNWAHASDFTKIDGGNLYVGSLIEIASSGSIRSGQTAYNTGTGWWIGDVGGTPKASMGVAGGAGWTWDGTTFTITGTIVASAGSIGGWTIGATALYLDTGVELTSSGQSPSDWPFYAGSQYANRATAPFRVSGVTASVYAPVYWLSQTSGAVTVTGMVNADAVNSQFSVGSTNNYNVIIAQNNQTALTIDTSKNATFVGNISMTGAGTVDGVDVSAHDHSGAGQGGTVTWASVNKATSSIADITTRTHSLLSSIGTDDHHAQAHALSGADHTGGISTTQHGSLGTIANAHAWADINKATSSIADITTRSAGDLSSGNLDVARMPLSGTWTVTGNVTYSRSVDADLSWTVQNLNGGAAAYAEVAAKVDNGASGTEGIHMAMFGIGYTTSGKYAAQTGVLEADSGLTGGLVLSAAATNAPIAFYSSNTLRMSIAAGNITFSNSTYFTSPIFQTPQIHDTSLDHQYVFAVNELTADRTVTLPLLTGDDTFVFQAHTQTLTNKTLTTPIIATIYGSASASGTITIEGTSHATDGSILLNPNGGHVGIGCTPPAVSGLTTLALPAATLMDDAVGDSYFSNNSYYNGSNNIARVAGSTAAARLAMEGGAVKFQTAAAVTGGSTQSFTDLLTVAATGNTVITGTLTVNGDQSGATDHVFDNYDDLALLQAWRDGKRLPFATGDLLNRDRLLRDSIVGLHARIAQLEARLPH